MLKYTTNRFFLFVIFVVILLTPFLLSIKGLYGVVVMQKKLSEITTNSKILGESDHKEIPGEPEYIWIPSINVSAKIQKLGVSSTGEMEVPNNSTDVGWFNLGSKPGENGNAVIAGHFNGKNGEKGVFAQLSELKLGDKLYVKDNNDNLFTFVVRESRNYDPGFAEEVFSANDGVHLNLITCEGIWNNSINSFSKRLVVFSDEEI